MPLNLYLGIYASGSVPAGWKPIAGGTLKYPVKNRAVLQELRRLLPTTKQAKWLKVIKKGNRGEVHYFEHGSGAVADVKYYE